MAFIDNFTRLCQSECKTPSKVCSDIGLSSGTYSYWKKSGRCPSLPTIKKIAEYFEVPIKTLTTDAIIDQSQQVIAKSMPHSSLNILNNTIRNSPHSVLTVEETLSKQEREFIELYRSFSIEQQFKLLQFAFALRDEKK